DAAAFGAWLRRFRRRESLRLVVRDVLGIDEVEATLAGASELAEACIEAALAHAVRELEPRYGTPRSEAGEPQQLCVVGMGKLGGGELNFSSDVDLVFAFPEAGHTDGARALANEDYFARLGQRLIQLLAEVDAEGFAFRVDMRLRPFGAAGRLALSFAAMEQYYQREGRDWERYAWVKARPVGGDRAAGARLVTLLRPFVYRRYLDYAAIDGLREMKALIDAEVARQDLADNIKLGPGGIREIEFIVQLAQLVRGGREPALRTPSLLGALGMLEHLGLVRLSAAKRLREAYRFLRRLENRLQMLRDEQVHAVPASPLDRARIAGALGHRGYAGLEAALALQRAAVAEEFAAILAPADAAAANAHADWAAVWRSAALGEPDAPGFGPDARDALHAFSAGATVRALEPRVRERLDRLMPPLLAASASSAQPDEALVRVLKLLAAIARRPSYLALLDEQAAARERVVSIFARSAFLAERVTAQPLLLDELLDTRGDEHLPDAASVRAELDRLAPDHDGDAEERLERLHEVREGALFQLGLAWISRRIGADECARRLSSIAALVVAEALDMALADTRAQYGALPAAGAAEGDAAAADTGIAVIAYGSFGGAELGFASDLDLVFVYDGALGEAQSNGARSVEGSRWFARVAQRTVHWLTTLTRSGRLYEVDVRLRPDGSKGLLVSSLDAFAEYQRERAWVWEHQALVRARAIAGDPALAARFATVRAEVLARPRDRAALAVEVRRMRERWRAELDRSDAARFDLKQGRGALVDVEFTLQALVLGHATAHPALVEATRTRALIDAAHAAGLLDGAESAALAAAHDALLAASLDRTLDAAPRTVARNDALAERTAEVERIAARIIGPVDGA
ncbi:MAG TPA: bifunctional [glutamate--ammonia ligase]-adenylyl-L-tyrosine phosphorylase/[glutamate--ammonia-ligase] adenylyltransferase, partial [Xanthomonadales bacterium]|nr:bifunctional [glutamate--ammonia ligase]-adenylyl-L-tyrosine phosphorylase/[glutamate--ammonia-ligase] adenylyltransferase [Xanthomonadales bacterium]